MADEGEIGPNDVMSDFKITTYSQPGHEQTFCSFEFNIKAGVKKIELTFNAPGATGVLFIPCEYYEPNIGNSTRATNIISSNHDKTECYAEVPTNFITSDNSPTKLEFKGIPESGITIKMSSILVGWENYHHIYYTFNGSKERTPIKIDNNTLDVFEQDPVEARLLWISNFVDKYCDDSVKKFPQFHIKQAATLEALTKIYPSGKKLPGGLITYVGTDDTANILSSIQKVSKSNEDTLKLLIRNSPDYDIATETSWLKEHLNALKITNIKTNKHSDSWLDSKDSQLIIDTYTVMSWPVENEEQTLAQITNRIESLDEQGSLILVCPVDCNVEKFSKKDKLPDLFKDQVHDFAKKVEKHLPEINLKIDGAHLGNTKYITIGKSSNLTNQKQNSAPTGFSYSTIGETPLHEKKEDKIANHSIEEITPVMDWDDYRDAVIERGQRNRMKRPIQLPIIETIRNHLEEDALNNRVENFIIVQWHPGWGKTSIVGEVLFPEDSTLTTFLEKYSFWVGTLDQVESWLQSSQKNNNDIVIIDDLHVYRKQ